MYSSGFSPLPRSFDPKMSTISARLRQGVRLMGARMLDCKEVKQDQGTIQMINLPSVHHCSSLQRQVLTFRVSLTNSIRMSDNLIGYAVIAMFQVYSNSRSIWSDPSYAQTAQPHTQDGRTSQCPFYSIFLGLQAKVGIWLNADQREAALVSAVLICQPAQSWVSSCSVCLIYDTHSPWK